MPKNKYVGCKVVGCKGQHYCKGYCTKHYIASRRNADGLPIGKYNSELYEQIKTMRGLLEEIEQHLSYMIDYSNKPCPFCDTYGPHDQSCAVVRLREYVKKDKDVAHERYKESQEV